MDRVLAALARHKGWSIAGGVLAASAIAGGINSATRPPAGNTAATAPTAAASTPAASPSPARSTPAPKPSSAPPAPPAAVPLPSCTLPAGRDLIVRYTVPGLQDQAQVLGEVDLVNCTTTLDDLAHTSPTGPGYCTEAAWADQNPGYNPDATPAPPLRHVLEAIGAGC